MSVSMKLETISPAKAEKYLSRNLSNRTLQKSTLALYSRLMENGDWMLNGDAIRFNTNGDLVDGQHRLQSVIATGVPLKTYVMRGLEVEAQLTIDQQRKRTAGDMLKMRGITNGNNLAAIVRMVDRWDNGERSIYGFAGGSAMLSAKEVVARIDASPHLYLEACRRGINPALMTFCVARVTGTMFTLFEREDASVAEEFFDYLTKGANLAEGNPVLTLRRYWLNLARNGRRANTAVYLMAGVRAWNAYAEGRPLHNIGWKTNSIPEVVTPKADRLEYTSEPLLEVSS